LASRREQELSAAAEATAKEEQRAIAAEALASRREQELSAAAEATAKEEQRAIAAEALASRREQELLLQERRAVAAEAVASRKEQELSITIEATSKEEVASTAQRSIEAEAAALRREQELSSSLELQVQRAAAAEELAKQRAQELSKAVDTATEQERRAATAEALANERLQELTAALDKVECEAQRARDAENLAAQRQQELLEAEAATAAQRNQSEELGSVLDSQKEEVAKLTSRLAEAEAQVAQIADLRAESASLREELASAKRTSSEQADKDAATQLELSSVREQVPKLQARIKELEEQLSHGALEAELAEERSRLEALQQELLLLRTASSQQADKEAATQLELSGLREQVSELQARIKDLEAENSESVALEAKTWEAKLQKELAAAKDVADEVSEAQRRDQEELRQRLASLEEELRSAVAAHRREVDRATAAEAATEESRRLSSQSREEVAKLHTLLAEAEAKLLQLPAIAADASSLREALAEAQKERDLQVVAANRSALALAEVQQERDLQVAAANRTAQEALEELQKAELARQSAVSKQAAERAGLVAEVECAQEARQREMRQAADLAISLKQEQVHCTTLEAELVNQRSRMEDLQQELVRLRTASSQQVHAAELELQKLKAEVDRRPPSARSGPRSARAESEASIISTARKSYYAAEESTVSLHLALRQDPVAENEAMSPAIRVSLGGEVVPVSSLGSACIEVADGRGPSLADTWPNKVASDTPRSGQFIVAQALTDDARKTALDLARDVERTREALALAAGEELPRPLLLSRGSNGTTPRTPMLTSRSDETPPMDLSYSLAVTVADKVSADEDLIQGSATMSRSLLRPPLPPHRGTEPAHQPPLHARAHVATVMKAGEETLPVFGPLEGRPGSELDSRKTSATMLESCASMVPEKILAEAFHQVATCHFHAGVLESGSPLDSSHTGRTVMEEDSAASPSSLGGGAQSTANLVSSHLDEALYSALARQSSTPQGAASVGSGDPGVALAAAAVVSEVTQRAKELPAAGT